MWKKLLGFAVLSFAMLFTLEGCASRAYRNGYGPGYGAVRVVRPHRQVVIVPGYRSYGPQYRDPRYYSPHDRHNSRKHKDKHHDRRHYDH
jgi:hypothetical protein